MKHSLRTVRNFLKNDLNGPALYAEHLLWRSVCKTVRGEVEG